MSRLFRRPAAVVELALLGVLLSAAILVITTAGTAQVLAGDGGEALPVIYILLAAISIPLACGISAALGRWRTATVSRAACASSLCVALGLRLALAMEQPGAAQAVYILGYTLEIVLDTSFWLAVSERLTTLELKKHAPFLATSLGIGGVLAGIASALLSRVVAAEDLLIFGAALFALAYLQYGRIERTAPALPGEDDGKTDGLIESLRATASVCRIFPLTGSIGVSVLLMSMLFCLQDYLALTVYAEAFADAADLAGFTAIIYAGQQAAELLLVLLLGKLVLGHSGPVVRNLLFPLTTLASLLLLGTFWGLPAAILLHVNANSVSNAVFEPVKTFNYTALPYQALAQVRMLVEGAVYPAGIALSGFVLLWLQATISAPLILLVAIVLAVVFLGAAATTGTSFLPSLVLCLRLRPLALSEFSRFARRRCSTRFSKADIRHLLVHPDADARRFGRNLAACLVPELLPRVPPPTSACPPAPFMLAAAGRALEDNDRANRRRAMELLAQSGDAAVPVARERLKSERAEVVSAAIEALGAIGTRRARRALGEYLRPLCQQGRLNLAASAALQQLSCSKTLPPGDADLLAAALADSNQRIVRRILDVKAATGHRRNVNFLRSLANAREPRIRSNAIEALASLPTGYLIRRVISLLDAEPLASERGYRRALAASPTTALWRAAAEDRWLRALAIRLFGPSAGMVLDARDEAMLDLLLFLRSVPLLRGFSFEDLANLAESADVLAVAAGDSIVEAGERITHLIFVQKGSVELHLNGSVVEALSSGASIGEATIVGGQAHAVAARAVSDTMLLRFPAATISDIFAEDPQLLTTFLDDLLCRMRGLYTNLAKVAPTEGVGDGRSGGPLTCAAFGPSLEREFVIEETDDAQEQVRAGADHCGSGRA